MHLQIDDTNYDVIIIHKRIRNTYIRVKNDLKIYVTAPILISGREIDKLLDKEKDSIKRMIAHQQHHDNKDNYILGHEVNIVGISNLKEASYDGHHLYVKDKSQIDKAYKEIALPIFMERLKYNYNLFTEDIPFPQLRIRKMTSRWGVCNRKNNTVTLNLELIKFDIKYIDYVIIHELSHFVYFNHSVLFWQTVSKYCPEYKKIRKELRK